MLHGLRFLARSIAYDLRKGLLARPLEITLFYVLLAAGLVYAERRYPTLTEILSRTGWITGLDADAAQLILATIAGSMMTTVSVVFSVLVMALSLASLQFSPRILRGFMADRPTQHTLGVFVGTFLYCLVVLGTVRDEPAPFVPGISVGVAMLLAAGDLVWLVYFIHHISHGIHANFIAERVGNETISIIDEEFPTSVGRADTHAEDSDPPSAPEDSDVVESELSGYVQLVNREQLLELAQKHEITIYQQHGIGEFVIEGNPLVAIAPAGRLSEALQAACRECFDLGPVRTMQQDVHYGIRQIVDMALKAISPAVNDPTTAATCIDQLGRVLAHLARRRILPLDMRDPKTGRLLMLRRAVTFRGSVDLAFNQLRQYGRADMAVCLRIVRALLEIATATDHAPHQEHALKHARAVEAGLAPVFSIDDRQELSSRLRTLERLVAASRERASSAAMKRAV